MQRYQKALDEQDREDERTTKRSRTSSSKKPTQILDLSPAPVSPVTSLPPTLPATPLPCNPYAHLLTPTGSHGQPQPLNYQYYYNTPSPQFPVSVQHVNPCYEDLNNIASGSRTQFPPSNLNYQFRPYNPKN